MLVGLGLGLIAFLLLTLLPTTPSGNISVAEVQQEEVQGTGSEIAMAMTAFDEALMELEDWLEP